MRHLPCRNDSFLSYIPFLEASADPRLTVVHGDILKFDYGSVLEGTTCEDDGHVPVKLIGNLPFNVATPLLLSYISMAAASTGPFQYGPVIL